MSFSICWCSARKWALAGMGLLTLFTPAVSADGLDYKHGVSFVAELKYPPDFPHFDYVNPHAPKQGKIRTASMGTWDTFNHILAKGTPVAGLSFTGTSNLLYDRMMEDAADEAASQYGRLAQSIAVAPDYSWVAFRMRPEARWHDGEPITADDVVFTFDAFKRHGSPALKTSLKDIEAIEKLGPLEVRYIVRERGLRNATVPLTLGLLPVLPKHYWETRDISRTTMEPPLGSGPYRVGDYMGGRWVEYERVEDYWGRDLPVMRGRYNWDYVKYDYFRDEDVTKQAHKGDVIDIRQDTNSKSWESDYDFPAVHRGLFKRELLKLSRAEGLWWAIFWNLRLERFQDPRVREALWMLYDFKWINRVLFFGFYNQGVSFFQNSDMASGGLPTADELELLGRFRDQLPPRLFEEPYRPPTTTGYGYSRDNVRRAIELFAEAGWHIDNGMLRNIDTGEPFTIHFVVITPSLQRSLMPYFAILERVGIEASVRVPEVSNYISQMRRRTFDASMRPHIPSNTPGLSLLSNFSSRAADIEFSRNLAGIKNPVIDYLLQKIIVATTQGELVAATRALDRVLLWNFYYVPGMSQPGYRLAYWDRFGIPEAPPLKRASHLDTWWYDTDKAERVALGLAEIEVEEDE